MRIAYFGPSGTFTEMALAKLEEADAFGSLVERVSAQSPPATLELVRDGSVDGAVVPIENSVEGSVNPTLDALVTGDRLQIIAETELDVTFSILARAGVTLADATSIRAYPVAAAQVRLWVAQHMPNAVVEFASSNAGAAEDVAAGLADAAVSTGLAGARLGLESLAESVADVAGARTRFVYVTRPQSPPERTGSDRTAIVLTPDNVPGILHTALAEFGMRDIDLRFIESRPTRTSFGTYRFYVDCVGHIGDSEVAAALVALHRKMPIRFLGSWPSTTEAGDGSGPPTDATGADWLDGLRTGRNVDR
ncbi:prephenate dehydratase [Actinomycetes bacterium M1A6_2h]